MKNNMLFIINITMINMGDHLKLPAPYAETSGGLRTRMMIYFMAARQMEFHLNTNHLLLRAASDAVVMTMYFGFISPTHSTKVFPTFPSSSKRFLSAGKP